jgi:NAD(P)-dependent dehydrogenase (short-subunit alcohol dehydrogenase family)
MTSEQWDSVIQVNLNGVTIARKRYFLTSWTRGKVKSSTIPHPLSVFQEILKRLGSPADIARAYLYLASEDGDYVNGTVLEVNGGLSI